MTGGRRLPIPEAIAAERVVAVIAAEGALGADLALGKLSADEFWQPAPRRVLAAVAAGADQLAAVERAAPPGHARAVRLAAVARLADVSVGTLDGWAADCPVMLDVDGRYASRVRSAALRRQVMGACADAHAGAALGEVERLARAVADLDRLTAALLGGAHVA